jgi:ATP-dependent RNA helicase DeaD
LIKRGVLDVSALDYFVLDEADEMLNMGFLDDIEFVLKQTNTDKQMLFFSATMPREIITVAKKYMDKDYKVIKVKATQMTNDNVQQIYFQVRESDKLEALTRIIDAEDDMYAVVFCRTKIECERLADTLRTR